MLASKLVLTLVCLVCASTATCTEGVLSEQPLAAKRPLQDALFDLKQAEARTKEFLADPTKQRVWYNIGGPNNPGHIHGGNQKWLPSWMINGMTVRAAFLSVPTGLRDNFDPNADAQNHPFLPWLRERCPDFVRRIAVAYGDPLGGLGVIINLSAGGSPS
ncbi:hypothetical protein BJX62DRAFT_237602 [Aspergillus germanicus]